jgi:hypothetical protein
MAKDVSGAKFIFLGWLSAFWAVKESPTAGDPCGFGLSSEQSQHFFPIFPQSPSA